MIPAWGQLWLMEACRPSWLSYSWPSATPMSILHSSRFSPMSILHSSRFSHMSILHSSRFSDKLNRNISKLKLAIWKDFFFNFLMLASSQQVFYNWLLHVVLCVLFFGHQFCLLSRCFCVLWYLVSSMASFSCLFFSLSLGHTVSTTRNLFWRRFSQFSSQHCSKLLFPGSGGNRQERSTITNIWCFRKHNWWQN